MDAQVDSILAGLTIQYGGKRNRAKAAPEVATTDEIVTFE